MSNIKHSAKNPDWGSPPWLVGAARKVMGGIALDPASTPEQNKIVGAEAYYTKEDDGLSKDWSGRNVYLNPPGGRIGKHSGPVVWWNKLVEDHGAGDFDEAIFVAFSIEFLQTSQQLCSFEHAAAICIPAKRIPFVGKGTALPTPTRSYTSVPAPSGSPRFFGVWSDRRPFRFSA